MRAPVFILAMIAVSAPRPARADDEVSVPSWLVSVGGGLALQSGVDPDTQVQTLDMSGLAGGVLDVRHVGDGYAIYGDGEAFPVGDIYGGRIGLVFGRASHEQYHEVIDFTKLGSSNDTTTYRVTSIVYNSTVRGAWGLDTSISVHDLAGESAVTLEAGFGLLSMQQLDLQLTYDLSHGAPGMRVQWLIAQGTGASWCMRLSVESLFSLHASPVPGLVSFTIGGGPGYHPGGGG